MDLYIFRHGAAETGLPGGDAGRILTREGKSDIRLVARWLKSLGVTPDIIATSPYIRARETAAITVKILACTNRIEVWEELAPGNPISRIVHRLSESGKNSVIVIGHEPMLSTLMNSLISPDVSARIAMVKGGIARIRRLDFSPRVTGELYSLVTPNLLRKR
ncbi:MAG: phosphohistidine phosphatase SixA [Methanoregulaceae archaeon]